MPETVTPIAVNQARLVETFLSMVNENTPPRHEKSREREGMGVSGKPRRVGIEI